MIPVKVIWDKKTDNLKTIREKLLSLLSKQVENKRKPELPLTIFNVGEFEQMELPHFAGIGTPDFLPSGELNYKTQFVPMWGFIVTYGRKELNGCTQSAPYRFMIPRKGSLENDLIENKIMFDPNHPFIFYL